MTAGTSQVPLVGHLVLDDDPHLVAHQCTGCGARFLGRRNGCASCGARDFEQIELPRDATLRTFTVVHVGPPGVAVPFVAGVVDCGGTTLQTNIVEVDADPAALAIGMPLRLTTYVAATDDEGTEAVAFAFRPLEDRHRA